MRLANQYETFLRSMVSLRGEPVGADQMGQIVDRAVASASPEERRSPVPSPDAINRLQQFLIQATETGRLRNIYSAEAARAAQALGAHGGHHGGQGFDRYDGQRGSSARFREIGGSGDGKGSGGPGSSGSSVSAPASGIVPPAYARSFADTGIGGGTLKTFAEVGLDRGTFNQFRKEGFSKEQIVDSAKDSKVLGWKGKEDLSIAQHASTEARKASVATERAKTPEERAKRLERERDLERQNEQRSDSDPRKQHDRRFWQRRHQDHLQHDAKAGLGTEAGRNDTGLSASNAKPTAADHAMKDKLMAKEAKRVAKNAKVATTRITSGFEVEPEKPKAVASATSNNPSPVRTAAAKLATPAVG